MEQDMTILKNEPMSGHTTFATGGVADTFVLPETTNELVEAVKTYSPHIVIGCGSNLLVSDDGYRGCIICTKNLDEKISHEVDGDITYVTAAAGMSMADFAIDVCEHSLTGAEFMHGIPGSIGGGVFMNAGAYDSSISDILHEVCVADTAGNVMNVPARNLDMSYRYSNIRSKDQIVLTATFALKRGDRSSIKARMDELWERRISKQPLEYPSAGSTFKRPEGFFAGRLIEECGVKGHSIGGASVSTKHSGFIINQNHATSSDIYALIQHVIEVVREKKGVTLEPEVRMIGDF
jgi:UDP-N-acetylmuramate dehydrogenase